MGDYGALRLDSDQLDTWPYKDLVQERISHIEEARTHSWSLAHNLYKIRATAAIEGRGLLKGPHCVSLQHDCTATPRVAGCPVTPLDYTRIIHTSQHPKIITGSRRAAVD